MILTVTLNPALDLWAQVPRVEPGPKLRLSDPRRDPGGGGINVARVIARLGGKVRAFAALGGAIGVQLAELMRAEGVELVPFALPGETRQSLSVRDSSTGGEYRFVLPGPNWTPELTAQALTDLQAAAPSGLVVLSGSQPPGVPDSFARDLAQRLGPGRLIVDTSGPALHDIAQGGASTIAVLRMDEAEARVLSGEALATQAESLSFAQALRDRGVAQAVVLARGAEGSVLACDQGAWACHPPHVPVLSKVGAGDSFTGAFALALDRGEPLPDALRAGTAAAAAAVMTPGTELCRADDVARLVGDCVLEILGCR